MLTVTMASNESTAMVDFEFVSFGFVIPSISLVGMISNSFNLFVLRSRAQFPESSYAYLFSLALADLLTLFFFFFNSFGRSFHGRSRYWRRFEVYGYFPIGSMTSNASVTLTVMVTLERFIFMYRPFLARSYCTRSIARKIIACLWAICILVNLPRFFVMTAAETGMLAFTEFGRSKFYRILSWIYTALFSISSSICLIVFNLLLVHAINRRRSAIQRKTFSTLFAIEDLHDNLRNNSNDDFGKKSLSCNTLNMFGCGGERTIDLSSDGAREADNPLCKDGSKSRGLSRSTDAVEGKSVANPRRKNCRLAIERGSLGIVISARQQQKQKEDFALTLTLIGVVIIFLAGELPSSVLSRNIVGPLFGEGTLVDPGYVASNIVATYLVVAQHSINFLVYYLLNHKFCQAVKKHLRHLAKVIGNKWPAKCSRRRR